MKITPKNQRGEAMLLSILLTTLLGTALGLLLRHSKTESDRRERQAAITECQVQYRTGPEAANQDGEARAVQLCMAQKGMGDN